MILKIEQIPETLLKSNNFFLSTKEERDNINFFMSIMDTVTKASTSEMLHAKLHLLFSEKINLYHLHFSYGWTVHGLSVTFNGEQVASVECDTEFIWKEDD